MITYSPWKLALCSPDSGGKSTPVNNQLFQIAIILDEYITWIKRQYIIWFGILYDQTRSCTRFHHSRERALAYLGGWGIPLNSRVQMKDATEISIFLPEIMTNNPEKVYIFYAAGQTINSR